MDFRRVRRNEWATGLFGAALLGAMFVDWYSAAGGRSVDAWQAFSAIDVVLAVTGGIAISVAVSQGLQRTPAVPLALAAITTVFGGVATLLVVIRAAAPPSVGSGSVTRDAGLWLGLACCAGIALCAWRSMGDERFPEAARANVHVEKLTLPPVTGARQ